MKNCNHRWFELWCEPVNLDMMGTGIPYEVSRLRKKGSFWREEISFFSTVCDSKLLSVVIKSKKKKEIGKIAFEFSIFY